MRYLAIIAAVSMALSVPAFAQDNDSNGNGSPAVTPGMVVIGVVGLGLAIWGISVASKKSCTSAC